MKKALLVFAFIAVIGFAIAKQHFNKSPRPIGPVTPAANVSDTTTSSQSIAQPTQAWKDGTYTGSSVDAYYGNVQVQVVISSGKISDVKFLDYPHDAGESRRINSDAMPMLIQEAIQSQSAKVTAISGASFTSNGFTNSLQSALSQAA